MSGNRLGSSCTVRIVAGGRPNLFCRHHSDGGDPNQDFARLRLGNRTYYRLQVQFVCKLHCFHLCHCFTPCYVGHTTRFILVREEQRSRETPNEPEVSTASAISHPRPEKTGPKPVGGRPQTSRLVFQVAPNVG